MGAVHRKGTHAITSEPCLASLGLIAMVNFSTGVVTLSDFMAADNPKFLPDATANCMRLSGGARVGPLHLLRRRCLSDHATECQSTLYFSLAADEVLGITNPARVRLPLS
jgi:hypothetical protein